MVSMMLLRRAFHHVASAAASRSRSRCAAVTAAAATATSASGGANRLLGRRPSPLGLGLGRKPLSSHGRQVEFLVEDKDLSSDEALWALYERWCKAYGQERDHDEMLRRFDCFKDTVLFIDRANKEAIRDGLTNVYELNMYADGKMGERRGHIILDDIFELPYAKGAVIYDRAAPFLSRDEEDEEN